MRTLVSVSFILLAYSAIAGNASGHGSGRAQIDRAQEEYRAALLSADTATLSRIWTDDYTFTNGSGMHLNKNDRLKNVKTGATDLQSVTEREREVRVYGGYTAIITGMVTIKGRYSEQAGSGNYRYINVWIKRDGRWQMAANQITPIAE
jgi:uncharacterized protein (TIGR02246 family)